MPTRFMPMCREKGWFYMKQPDSLDMGTKMDVVRHRLTVAREDLDTAHLTFKAEKYRAANNRANFSAGTWKENCQS